MANYIKSGAVRIFPSSLRSGEYSSGKFTTEYNLTRLLRSVTDNDSFVIADPKATDKEGPHYNASYYIFVINGFYFEVEKEYIDDLKFDTDDLFASIRLDNDGRLLDWSGSTRLDNKVQGISYICCTALYFSNKIPDSTEDFKQYTLNLKASDRFAKFTTDTFNWKGTSLNDILDSKQNKFTPTNQFNLSKEADLVKGILDPAHGGTGKDALSKVTVRNSMHLVDDNENVLNVGGKTAVCFKNGIPVEVKTVEGAGRLNDSTNTALNVGSATKPIYFKNGVPVLIGNNIDAYSLGLQAGAGQKDTSSKNHMTYTSVYFDGAGKVQKGFKINISNTTPQGSPGEAGDLWFKYSNS